MREKTKIKLSLASTSIYVLKEPLHIMTYLFICSLQTTMQKDPCGWMVQSRIWQHDIKCGINETVDLSLSGTNTSSPFGIDLSVVNVFHLFEATRSSLLRVFYCFR